MELYVDGILRPCRVDGDATLHDALETVRRENAEGNRAIIGLTCDGRDVLGDSLHGLLDEPAESFGRIDVRTGSPGKLVAHALNDARETLEAADRDRQELVRLLGTGRQGDAVIMLGSCLGRWWQTNEAISKSLGLLGVIGEGTEGAWEQLADALEPVTARLTDIRDAVKAQDYVSLADILEYEFAEVTQAWRGVIDRMLNELPEGRPGESQSRTKRATSDGAKGAARAPQSPAGEPATSRDPDFNSL
ncbi:MAG: hypothetical protein HOP29_07330 [Phycisphaerales bacterium]|nr:hypothetical protein [Phycisphaerales bacterium]